MSFDSRPTLPDNPLSAKTLLERPDLGLIEQWIEPNTRILDLGCGNGLLLAHLNKTKQTQGYGIEINPKKITECIQKGVNVIEQDLNQGLGNFQDNQFDTVIVSQTLQAVKNPIAMLEDMLKVGKKGIVSFPNFGHWRIRMHLNFFGTMPKSESLPYEWYDTPNIHLCTVRDFEALCAERHYKILNKWVVDDTYKPQKWQQFAPNILGKVALYQITRF